MTVGGVTETAGNFLQHQSRNRRLTVMLYVVFGFLAVILGCCSDYFLFQENSRGILFSVPLLPVVVVLVVTSVRRASLQVLRLMGREDGGWEEDDHEERTMVLFFAVIIGATLFFAASYSTGHRPGIGSVALHYTLPYCSMLAVLVAVLAAVWSRRGGTGQLLWMTLAREVPLEGERERVLRDVVEEVSIAAGIPPPAVYIVRDADPNAYSMGTVAGESSIVVTEGLLQTLDREELQAVIAHEVAHIRNGDTRVMTTLAVLFGTVVLLADWSRKGMIFGGAWRSLRAVFVRGVAGIICLGMWLVTVLFAGVMARLLALAVSRTREYLADASAVELTRNPGALVSALTKLDRASSPTVSVNRVVSHLCIVDPLGRRWNAREGWLADLFATHPPMVIRTARLRGMAYQDATAGLVASA